MLFAVLAVAAQPDRDYIRQKTLEGQRAATAKGNHGGRPKVLDEDMIIFARALHDKGVPVPEIAAKLVIKTGKNAGKHPSVARSTAPSPMTRQQQRRLPPDQCHRPIDPITRSMINGSARS